MKKFIETILNIYNIEELRGRILTTLSLLLVYRLGAQVVLPGIDSVQLAELANRTDGGGLLGILNAFTGGAFANASVFALGIMPYISASIVVGLGQSPVTADPWAHVLLALLGRLGAASVR